MRLISLLALVAWLSVACSSGGTNDSDTKPAADTSDVAAETEADVPVTVDVQPDPGPDLSVVDVVTDHGTDPGQPDTADATEFYATCSELFFQCVAKCDDEGDQTCETACLGKAEPAAAALMATLGACAGTNCADMTEPVDYIDCLGNADTRCGNEFSACTGGTSRCKDVRACWLTECSTGEWDHECAIGCMATGDEQAANNFASFYLCIFENCGAVEPANFQACYDAKANNECSNQSQFCAQLGG